MEAQSQDGGESTKLEFAEREGDDDAELARRFWEKVALRGPEEEAMRNNIKHRVREGVVSVLIQPGEVTEETRERIAALRELAEKMGYEIGRFVIRGEQNPHVANATISRASRN